MTCSHAEVCLVLEPTYRAVFDGLESQLELPLAGRDWLITVSPLGSHEPGCSSRPTSPSASAGSDG